MRVQLYYICCILCHSFIITSIEDKTLGASDTHVQYRYTKNPIVYARAICDLLALFSIGQQIFINNLNCG